jgi:cytochrome c peroxidase
MKRGHKPDVGGGLQAGPIPGMVASMTVALIAVSVFGGFPATNAQVPTTSLGARLFADERFASPLGDFATSCASCHFFTENAQGPRAGADFLSRSWIPYRSSDPRRHTVRNAPTIYDAALMPSLHYDGEFRSLDTLVAETLVGRTMGWLENERDAAARHVQTVAARAEYRQGFADAYGADVASMTPSQALAAVGRSIGDFMRSLSSPRNSAFDAFVAANGLPASPASSEAVTAYARRMISAVDDRERSGTLKLTAGFGKDALTGLRIFFAETGDTRRGNCVTCHPPPTFSDASYHNLGISQAEYDSVHGEGRFAALTIPGPRDAVRPMAIMRDIPERRTPEAVDLGYWNFANPGSSRLHRANETDDQFLERMIGTFKTPSLRNLALTSPYMHNGVYQNLPDTMAEIIRLSTLARRGMVRASDEAFEAVRIDESDIAPLIAFLNTLNDQLYTASSR